jgi:hypothetical protein
MHEERFVNPQIQSGKGFTKSQPAHEHDQSRTGDDDPPRVDFPPGIGPGPTSRNPERHAREDETDRRVHSHWIHAGRKALEHWKAKHPPHYHRGANQCRNRAGDPRKMFKKIGVDKLPWCLLARG